ncbi:MAG: hypothetical protein ACXAB5_00790 [Candidatus Thorarchaeota archaeon]
MRVLVVGSCGKRKLHKSPKQPKCQNIDSHHRIDYWKQRFSYLCTPARDMYIGPQSTELVKGVDLLRTIPNVEVQLVIVSAGFGILQEQDLVPPYDCSFTNMKMSEVRKRSEDLELQSSLMHLINKNFDLVYLALGKRYLVALGKNAFMKIQTPVIVFHDQESKYLIRIPCSGKTVKAFSNRGHKIHGVVGFKGDLLRVLTRYALEQPSPYSVVKKWAKQSYLRKLIHRLSGLEISKK